MKYFFLSCRHNPVPFDEAAVRAVAERDLRDPGGHQRVDEAEEHREGEEGQEGRNAFNEKRKPDFSKFPRNP